MKTASHRKLAMAGMLLCAACSSAGEDASNLGTVSSSILGQDTYLYFRCNATGWGVDDTTRLLQSSPPEFFTLSYEVTQDWMVSGFDTCTFVETNQYNGWGTQQNFYDKRGDQLLVVPETGPGVGQLRLSQQGEDYHFRVNYAAKGSYQVKVNWANGAFSIERADLSVAVYPAHNDASDPSRFNIVFVARGYSDEQAALTAVKRVVDLDRSVTIPNAWGLMQIPVFSDNAQRFNFWMVRSSMASPVTTVADRDVEFGRYVPAVQANLPNRVIPVYIQPEIPGVIEESSLRYGCGVYGEPTVGRVQGAVHEILHTFAALPDEYETVGETYSGELDVRRQLFLWKDSPSGPNDYDSCLANASWAGEYGNGCGQDGVIDCIDTTACPLPLATSWNSGPYDSTPGDVARCCLPGHPDCFQEIACFEGALRAQFGVWRPTASGLMRNTGYDGYAPSSYLSIVQQAVTTLVIQKGPAIGRVWYEIGAPAGFVPDYDPTTSEFAD